MANRHMKRSSASLIMKESESEFAQVVSDSLRPHGL